MNGGEEGDAMEKKEVSDFGRRGSLQHRLRTRKYIAREPSNDNEGEN